MGFLGQHPAFPFLLGSYFFLYNVTTTRESEILPSKNRPRHLNLRPLESIQLPISGLVFLVGRRIARDQCPQ